MIPLNEELDIDDLETQTRRGAMKFYMHLCHPMYIFSNWKYIWCHPQTLYTKMQQLSRLSIPLHMRQSTVETVNAEKHKQRILHRHGMQAALVMYPNNSLIVTTLTLYRLIVPTLNTWTNVRFSHKHCFGHVFMQSLDSIIWSLPILALNSTLLKSEHEYLNLVDVDPVKCGKRLPTDIWFPSALHEHYVLQ